MDILKLTSDDRTDPIYSFLSVSWCMLADIDIESEKIRWMGNTRFYVWAMLRVMKLRRYRAVLSYLGEDVTHKDQCFEQNVNHPINQYEAVEEIKEESEVKVRLINNSSVLSSEKCELSKTFDPSWTTIDCICMYNPHSIIQLLPSE